jgi:dihydrofolate reductase
MEVSIVLAHDLNLGIGNKGGLPWPKIPEDMRLFGRLTRGKSVIMGRATWDSLKEPYKPLPKRHNIVVSRGAQNYPYPEGATGVFSLEEALTEAYCHPGETNECVVIGGATLYNHFFRESMQMPISQTTIVPVIYATVVFGKFECDTHVADYRAGRSMQQQSELLTCPSSGLQYQFETWV